MLITMAVSKINHKLFNVLCVTVLCVIYGVTAKGIGERCTANGYDGFCQLMSECVTSPLLGVVDTRASFARREKESVFKGQKIDSQCESDGVEHVICCVEAPGVPTSTPLTRSSTTTLDPLIEAQCAVIPESLTTKKTGQKAWDKCIDYQKQLIYPCERSVAVLGGYNRVNNCKHGVSTPIYGGATSNADEFPHMVQLGYVAPTGSFSDAKWSCGGTLLSEWFILTAGHCTSLPVPAEELSSKKYTHYLLKYVALGALKSQTIITTIDHSLVYVIAKIFKHDGYKSPSKYNDIALLKTETGITLSPSAVPACLDVFGGDKSIAAAIGWGEMENQEYSDRLLKVTLNQFSYKECHGQYSRYPRFLYMSAGLNETTQICYGHRTRSQDTCRGDSGGPLTIWNPRVDCMYSVIGVVSLGACGDLERPGIYTKVSHYVPWIESVVWPDY